VNTLDSIGVEKASGREILPSRQERGRGRVAENSTGLGSKCAAKAKKIK